MEYNGPKLISMDSNSVHILDSSVADKLEKKNISPSVVTGLEGCHARWAADQYVIGELVETPPDNAARRGNLFHSTMENFFALPKNERTKDAMKEAVKETLVTDEYVDLSQNRDVVMWLRQAINGYYNMGGEPEKVDIAMIERAKTTREGKKYQKLESGIEIFVKDYIGESTRPTLGFIDQVIVDPTKDDGSVVVQDWKTGQSAKVYKSHTKGNEGLPEQRQQIIYAELLRKEGVKVSGARLIYPVAKQVVNVNLGDNDLREKSLKAVEEADKKLDVLIETNEFEMTPSFLCSWCPLSKLCPKAQIKPYEKMQLAFASQPEEEILEQGIEVV